MRGRRRALRLLSAAGILAVLAACGGRLDAGGSASPMGNADRDKLAQVLARGTLTLPTDLEYPPASYSVETGERLATTKCSPDQLTGPQVDGYDVATGKLVAEALGVEPCFVTPTWNQLLAGHWGDRFDVAFSSIGITRSRMEALYFTRPYYATPESFFVRIDADPASPGDLSGLRIGVCSGCFAELYLQGRLDIPGASVTYRVTDASIVGYAVERSGLEDVAAGKLDAFLCQDTAGQAALDDGLALRILQPAAYVAYPAGAMDRSSGLAMKAFWDRVNEILIARHADGTFAALSLDYFDRDYASAAGRFDIESLEQTVP